MTTTVITRKKSLLKGKNVMARLGLFAALLLGSSGARADELNTGDTAYDHSNRIGVVHDYSRIVPFLRRHGAEQKCPVRDDAVFCDYRIDVDSLGLLRLFDCLR